MEAVNLDGGGSSACAIRGAVANSPSEGVERPVADSLLVFADEVAPPPAQILTLPVLEHPLTVGETRVFALPEGVDPASVVWTLQGGVGFIDQEGSFRTQRPGKGTLVLWQGTQATRLPFTVVKAGETATVKPQAKLDDAAFVPQAVFAEEGTKLTITVANSEGDRLGNETITLAVTGGTVANTLATTNPRGEVTVTIQWDPTTALSARQVKISSPGKRFSSVTIKPVLNSDYSKIMD